MTSMRRFGAIAAMMITVMTILGMGCASKRNDCVPPELVAQSTWIDLNSPETYLPPNPTVDQRLASALTLNRDRVALDGRPPLNVLAISGGGKFGAFGVGVLKGWTDAGSRPEFDVVTGISTGALAAPLAFLGPEFDEPARQLFTEIETRDIYNRQRLPGILFGDAIASNKPLRQLIDRQVTPDLVRRVAHEHTRGRHLYIGTTNLDSHQLVTWDMGPIAARGDIDLFRQIILASASVPGYFSPVKLPITINGTQYSELHSDGGISATAFVNPHMIGVGHATHPSGLAPAGTRVWVIINGKLFFDPTCVKPKPFSITSEAISGLLYTLARSDVRQIFTLCLSAGAELRLASLPQNITVDSDSLTFEPAELRRLYKEGYRFGRHGEAGWGSNIPALLEEHRTPRTGVEFAAPITRPVMSPHQPTNNPPPIPPNG